MQLFISSTTTPIEFRVATTDKEREAIFAQRARIYTRYGYVSDDAKPLDTEKDNYDTHSVHIGAWRGDYLLGSVRLILPPSLPITTCFAFSTPPDVSDKRAGELSRLVVERRPEDADVPRNIVMLFLARMLLDVAKKHQLAIGFAYIKTKLKQKLQRLGLPLHYITPFTCIYPKTGFMAPYFESANDPALPVYFVPDEVASFLGKLIDGEMIVQRKSGSTFVLSTTIYARMLRTLGILR